MCRYLHDDVRSPVAKLLSVSGEENSVTVVASIGSVLMGSPPTRMKFWIKIITKFNLNSLLT